MAIPVLFEPTEIDGRLYVDGGVSYNFPLTTFDEKGGKNRKTLGIRADTREEIDYFLHGIEPEPKPKPGTLVETIKRTIVARGRAQDIAHYQANAQWRTVYNDTEDV